MKRTRTPGDFVQRKRVHPEMLQRRAKRPVDGAQGDRPCKVRRRCSHTRPSSSVAQQCAMECSARTQTFGLAAGIMDRTAERDAVRRAVDSQYMQDRLGRQEKTIRSLNAQLLEARGDIARMKRDYDAAHADVAGQAATLIYHLRAENDSMRQRLCNGSNESQHQKNWAY